MLTSLNYFWQLKNTLDTSKNTISSGALSWFQSLLESEYLNTSTRVLGPDNFRGKRPELGSTHAQQGLCFIAHAPKGEGTDVAVERSCLCSGTLFHIAGARRWWIWELHSIMADVVVHLLLVSVIVPWLQALKCSEGESWVPNGGNNTQESNIFKWLNYFSLEKAENVNG